MSHSAEHLRSPLLEASGAVEADGRGVAAHYGQPLKEQRELARGRATVDLSHEGVVLVSGADRLSWLHSMTTQSLTGLRPWESAETLLLDPRGRIEQVMRIVDDGAATWVLVDAGQAESLVEFLTRMRFALRVEVSDVSADYATVLVHGGRDRDVLRADVTVAAEWRDPWAHVQPGGWQYAAAPHPAGDWDVSRLVVPRAERARIAELAASGAIGLAGLSAVDALEIEAWRPTQRGEVDDRAIPNELDWLRSAVHLTKGCYRGQETVAKIHNLGHPPRRLALLHLDGSDGELPAEGSLVTRAPSAETETSEPRTAADARPVGRVTRAALHHEWGGIALALVKRGTAETENLLLTLPSGRTITATQQVIVPPSAGATRDLPRLPRLG